ncbi:hypothetical protein [Methanofollis fontis]|uniref:Uncharacterized protein n=1 Tax=Methanofollis fontis TaxID=2052832 RepID=A0A483CV10_9EURY|nr:hypothetical protein [Methanofollis fontis]TAJ44807.1 hypothetical protein CUJ86_05815 [Methanofollis fontis]
MVLYPIVIVVGFILLLLFCIGAPAILTYHALIKVRPAAGRGVPIMIGLVLSAMAPVVSPVSLPVSIVIMAMGVLTPFMLVERYYPERHRYTVLLIGSVVAGSIRLIMGFAMLSGGGDGSPIFHLLTSMTSSDAGFLIMNSVALYLEMVIGSALIFGVILMTVVAWRKMSGKK